MNDNHNDSLNEMTLFTLDNFSKGFLIDDEFMAGISESKESPGTYSAFIVKHSSGEVVGAREFTNLPEAIRSLNSIPRPWIYEPVSKCGSGNCGSGKCGAGGCKKIPDEKKGMTEESSTECGPCEN